MRMLICAVTAASGVLLSGCDPRVKVLDNCFNVAARITIDEETCGEFVSAVKTETPSNYVITVTFKKRQEGAK